MDRFADFWIFVVLGVVEDRVARVAHFGVAQGLERPLLDGRLAC